MVALPFQFLGNEPPKKEAGEIRENHNIEDLNMAKTPETPTDMLGSSFLNSKKSAQIKIYWTQIAACSVFSCKKLSFPAMHPANTCGFRGKREPPLSHHLATALFTRNIQTSFCNIPPLKV